jgi:hypothetical protein
MAHIILATGDLAIDRADSDESFVATADVLRPGYLGQKKSFNVIGNSPS